MAIPPFPSQDLAKLVLGYLAEEQLMTAYDEFLQASPYLDALRNEYDRIFMTSLKNILAEYRAVKIYVETCKPFILRRRLFQCTNLFDIVKLLVQNVDINKLINEEQNVDKSSSNPQISCNPTISQIEASSLESSVETTPLADLPGNVTTKKKSLKTLDRDQSNVQIANSLIDDKSKHVTTSTSGLSGDNPVSSVNEEVQNNIDQKTDNSLQDGMIKNKKAESVQKIDEFDNILDFVCKNGNDNNHITSTGSDNIVGHHQRISTAGTFQDFTTGIYNKNKIDATASTSAEIINAQAPLRRNVNNTFVNIGTINAADLKFKSSYTLNVGCIKNNQGIPVLTTELPSQMKPKSNTLNTNVTREESKIKILSDIKVDQSFENIAIRPKMGPLVNNATSTPHNQMPTIVINGTPAYRHIPQNSLNYTKDEIMAMPTIILVPATETKTSTTNSHPGNTVSTVKSITTATTSCAQNVLKPLVIDVTSDMSVPHIDCEKNPNEKNQFLIGQKAANEQSLIKTVEVTGHVSVPKENSLLTTFSKGTPQGLPPKRKSSSTPRRTSHVRVLDFTTPRRILQETINELSSNNSSETEVKVKTDQLSTEVREVDANSVLEGQVANTPNATLKSDVAKENKIIPKKKNNWDADLRALIVPDAETSNKSIQKSKSKTKSTNSKKKKSDDNNSAESKEENNKSEKKKKKSSSKVKDNKNKKTEDINKEEGDVTYNNKETSSVAIKPTINIITSNEWSTNQDKDKNQKKVNTSNDKTDTPESERIALQNAIGAKLNLSDLLETPYKQALYDIQMDTPKYLGPDLPDEPISEVKIMNIPTPRFLCSPQGALATPSSYSSRPTDYSSGGASYYNPDEQDYVISTEILEGPSERAENVKTSEKSEKPSKKVETSKSEEPKSRRPVRKCRKNVSYYNNPINANTEDDMKHNDSINIDSSLDKPDNIVNPKRARDAKRKSETGKKNDSLKKTKSPKTFMKIKPRRATPVKVNLGGKSRKHSESSQHKSQKRTNIKDTSNSTLAPASVPTKSRRKSSTPRKLHYTKPFNSQHSENLSPESVKSKENMPLDSQVCSHDSDIEQLPLRWSDDNSQDGKSQDRQLNTESANDGDDISKIKEYIETSVSEKPIPKGGDGSLHIDLIKRGFDIETAKIIERDLLDSPCSKLETTSKVIDLERLDVKNASVEDNSVRTTSDTSFNLEIVDSDDDSDEVELSIHECNEDTANFINHEYVELSPITKSQPATLKDNYTMEICIDDGLTVRLRATTFSTLLEQDPKEMDTDYSSKETEIAVSSISHIDKLYTPMKDAKAQIYEIFDSTLTSIDTPFKAPSPRERSHESESIVTNIELEVEKVDYKEKIDVKKRKRLQISSTSDDSPNCSKRPKSDPQYLLQSAAAEIQNIDIESVLTKLHGP